MYIAQPMSWHKVSDSDDELQDVNNEVSVGSDGSTVQETADTGEGQTEVASEPLAFLQGLNSGNLMQFSQQSVLREMMLDDIKAQVNTLPKLENHNNGGYDFCMVLKEPPKSHWMFSRPLNKLYIRMNKTFNVDVQFRPKLPIQPLNLRVFLCFTKDVSGPVLRCQNHLSTEPAVSDFNDKMRENILRCENPNASYCGSAQGKGIAERYSVFVPLNMSRSGNLNNVQHTLAFRFMCQNSCFGRKETCLIFCLENSCGDILGQQVLEVKICTCPKRDRNQDERQLNIRKRKSLLPVTTDEESSDVKRPKRRRRTASYQDDVKDEVESNESGDIDAPLPDDWQATRTENGDYRLVITCPKKEWLVQSIEFMIEKTAAASLRSPNNEQLRQHAQNLLDFKKQASQLP